MIHRGAGLTTVGLASKKFRIGRRLLDLANPPLYISPPHNAFKYLTLRSQKTKNTRTMSKRKLNEHDVPEASEPSSPSATPKKQPEEPSKTEVTFSSFGLEPRLLRGIKEQKWATPTAVQAKAIPLALEGKDILARSGTGTGPLLQIVTLPVHAVLTVLQARLLHISFPFSIAYYAKKIPAASPLLLSSSQRKN
jgi:hypothetical protein